MAAALHVSVITPKATRLDTLAERLVAPTAEGQVTILAGHASFVATVSIGTLTVRGEGVDETLFTAGGLLEVQHDRALLLLQSAERVDDIDVTRAEQDLVAAQARLRQLAGPQNADYAHQSRRLARAAARVEATRERRGS